MKHWTPIRLFVAAVTMAALVVTMANWFARGPFPGLWGIGVLVTAGFLLEISSSKSRAGDSAGSLSFLTDLSAGILFGPFWGALVTVASLSFGQIYSRRPLVKAVFNIAQRAFCFALFIWIYKWLGGS